VRPHTAATACRPPVEIRLGDLGDVRSRLEGPSAWADASRAAAPDPAVSDARRVTRTEIVFKDLATRVEACFDRDHPSADLDICRRAKIKV